MSLSAAVRRMAAAGLLAVPLSPAGSQEPRLGSISFPTSAGARAQREFIRGVLFLHSFEYDQAATAFRAAQAVEPAFALAYWGEALTYTHPVWNQQDLAAARAALERLGPTAPARAAKAPTERERMYLATAEALYGEGGKARRDTLFSQAMAEVVRRFPEDFEAKAFYSLALLGLNQGVRDFGSYMLAAVYADSVFRHNPDHPGGAHYLIHAFDDPIHAPLGLEAARAYSKIAPSAAHAQHMTTHIFLALGMWDEVISQNVVASNVQGSWRPGHYTQWLVYGLQQEGRFREAGEVLAKVRGNMGATPSAGSRGPLAIMQAQYLIDTERWTDDVASWEINTRGTSEEAQAATLLWRGLRAYRTRDAASLAAMADSLGRVAGAKPGVVGVMALELEGMSKALSGDEVAARERLTAAAALEERLPIDFGPPAMIKPADELLCEVWPNASDGGAAGRMKPCFRALERTPGRLRALLALRRAAEAAQDAATVRRVEKAIAAIRPKADPSLLESNELR